MSEPARDDELEEIPGVGKRQLSERELEQRRDAAKKGGEATAGRRGPGRPKGSRNKPKPSADTGLEQRLREPLLKVAEWLTDRNPELSNVLREDAGKIAGLLAKLAAADRTPPFFVAIVGAIATLLEPFDAFGRLARVLYVQARARRHARRERERLSDPDEPPAEVDPDADLPPVVTPITPDRFAYDAEPPEVN